MCAVGVLYKVHGDHRNAQFSSGNKVTLQPRHESCVKLFAVLTLIIGEEHHVYRRICLPDRERAGWYGQFLRYIERHIIVRAFDGEIGTSGENHKSRQ